MAKYPDSVKEGLKSLKAAKAVIKSLFEENQTIKGSLKITQDELENWKSKFHESDKQKSILDEKLQTTVISEIFKYISATVASGIGINLLTGGKIVLGIILVSAGTIIFIGITYQGRKR